MTIEPAGDTTPAVEILMHIDYIVMSTSSRGRTRNRR